MTKLYKLTDENCCTYGGCQWGENVTHTASGRGDLCSSAWLHAYTHPVLAYMLNPIHADFKNPQLWECEGKIGITDHGLKVGCTRLTTIRRMDIAVPQRHHRLAFGIGCAYNVYSDPNWRAWAKAWVMNGKRDATAAAATAADAAAADAAAATAAAAAATAAAAAAATEAADYAAAAAARTARAAAYAARAADAAAYAAARAAIPFEEIADWAMTVLA